MSYLKSPLQKSNLNTDLIRTFQHDGHTLVDLRIGSLGDSYEGLQTSAFIHQQNTANVSSKSPVNSSEFDRGNLAKTVTKKQRRP